MTTSEILKAAREKIQDPDHWTQGSLARNAFGMKTYPFAENAVKWCATGAVAAVVAFPKRPAIDCLKRAVEQFPSYKHQYSGLINFNDRNSHSRVLQLFDLAIQIAELAEEG